MVTATRSRCVEGRATECVADGLLAYASDVLGGPEAVDVAQSQGSSVD